jgi:hypothetical protein
MCVSTKLESRIQRLQALLFITLLLVSTGAGAVCLAGTYYQVFVGDTVGDTSCTYNSIQEALDATYLCPTTVRITREHTYTTQHLTASNKTKPLYLQGEADSVTCNQLAHCPSTSLTHCHDPTTQPLVTIDGNNTSGSVLTITGNSNIILRDLTITRGSADASLGGGGIQFDGTGSLYLDTTTVSLNYAGYGGGININGNGGPATLTLGANSLVINNVAEHDGGGIRLTGESRLFALQPYTLIGYNQAPNGDGGGIAVISPARADIGSPGYNGAPVIEYNQAEYGGGISAVAADKDQTATVRLFTTDASSPVSVSRNSASHAGGGIFLKPIHTGGLFGGPGFATFCARDFRIDNNVAQEGTAIYADEDNTLGSAYVGAEVYLNGDAGNACNTPETMSSLGAVTCTSGTTCNTIDDNAAQDSGGTPTAGATILAQTNAALQVNRVTMRNNQGAHVIRSFGPDPNSDIAIVSDCLIADNVLTAEMIRVDNDGNNPFAYYTTVDGCTIVNNSNQGAPVIFAGHPFALTRSIVDESGIDTLHSSDLDHRIASYVLATDIFTLPDGAGLVEGQPTYVDAAQKDYHLQPTSLGVDFAPKNGGEDLDGKPRDIDLSEVPNTFGPRDIGAYELQYVCSPDTIYCNGFEG